MRRLLFIIAAAVVAIAQPMPVAASAQPPQPRVAQQLTSGSAGACDEYFGVNQHVGVHRLALDPIYVTGIRGHIKYGDRLYPCTDSFPGFNDNRGASVWVGIQGGLNDPEPPDVGFNIIQLGMAKCATASGPSDSPCTGSRAGQLRYFYAAGRSCPGYTDIPPYGHDLGWADVLDHEYHIIWDPPNNVIRFYIDTTVVKVLSASPYYCWLNRNWNEYAAEGERFDSNDGIGTTASHMLFRGMRYGQYQEGWRTTDFNDYNCINEAPELHCNVDNSDPGNAAIWTDDQ